MTYWTAYLTHSFLMHPSSTYWNHQGTEKGCIGSEEIKESNYDFQKDRYSFKYYGKTHNFVSELFSAVRK